jgi:hypothetical protein
MSDLSELSDFARRATAKRPLNQPAKHPLKNNRRLLYIPSEMRGATMAEAAAVAGRKNGAIGFLKVIGALVGIALLVFAALAIYGASLGRGSFNGTNDTVYEAMSVYGASYTREQADSGVDDVREQADVSESEAEQVAVQAVRAGLPPDKWGEFGSAAAKLAKLKRDGVID